VRRPQASPSFPIPYLRFFIHNQKEALLCMLKNKAGLSCYAVLGRLRQYRTNELVRWRMHFLSDAIAEIEGLLEVNRDFCKKQMAEKASPALPTNCAVVP